MYDYSSSERSSIENVDHEIHILGVKLGYFPYLLWGFLIGLFADGPLFGIGMIVLAVVICRIFYAAETRGEPITFDARVAKIIAKVPFGLGVRLMPGQAAIEHARAGYRE